MALLWLKSTGVSPPFGADGCFAHSGCRGGEEGIPESGIQSWSRKKA